MEIGTEATRFPENKYMNGIFVSSESNDETTSSEEDVTFSKAFASKEDVPVSMEDAFVSKEDAPVSEGGRTCE